MPPSTSDTLPRSAAPAPAHPVGGGTALVEAATAEQALAEVHRRHGAAARIVQAEKVLRGGVGGFFQRELVQLTVDLEAGGIDVEQRPLTPEDVHDDRVGRRFLDAVQQAMVRDEQDGGAPPGETFAELLDRAVGPQAPDGSLLGDAGQLPAAAPPGPAGPGAAQHAVATSDTTAAPSGIDAALARLTAEVDAGERRSAPAPAWGDALPRTHGATLPSEPASAPPPRRSPEQVAEGARRRAGERMRAAAAAAVPPAEVSVTPTASTTVAVEQERPAWATRTTSPDGPWSLDGLVRLGLPRALVGAVDAHRPTDDLAWIGAVAAVVREHCRELPAGRAVLVGPGAPDLADARGIEVCRLDESAPRRGHVALESVRDGAARWLGDALGTRWLDVVAGGDGWRDWLFDGPAVVSWAHPAALPDALAAAVELGLPLGYGLHGRRALRATPVEVALTLRGLLEVRS